MAIVENVSWSEDFDENPESRNEHDRIFTLRSGRLPGIVKELLESLPPNAQHLKKMMRIDLLQYQNHVIGSKKSYPGRMVNILRARMRDNLRSAGIDPDTGSQD